jgi:hypothetical protein
MFDRYERARTAKLKQESEPQLDSGGATSQGKMGSVSAAVDTIVRMHAGLEGRTIADKLADPNRYVALMVLRPW